MVKNISSCERFVLLRDSALYKTLMSKHLQTCFPIAEKALALLSANQNFLFTGKYMGLGN